MIDEKTLIDTLVEKTKAGAIEWTKDPFTDRYHHSRLGFEMWVEEVELRHQRLVVVYQGVVRRFAARPLYDVLISQDIAKQRATDAQFRADFGRFLESL